MTATTTIPPGAVTITRRQAHNADACVEDTRRVLDYLRARDGRIPRMDQQISLRDVADVLGVGGVIWCLRALGEDRLMRMFAVRCARRALRAADVRDARPWRALRTAQWYAHGWATRSDLASAWDAARDAAQAAARDAAQDAGWAVARSAEWDAVGYAAGYTARGAAWGAAQDAAQASAWDAAWDAAQDAAGYAAARSAAWGAAWDAAWDAERDAQPNLLLSMAGYGGEA